MSVVTQDGDSVLNIAVRWGMTEVVSLLVEAGANTDLQNEVRRDIIYVQVLLNIKACTARII